MRYLLIILSLILSTHAAAECPADRDWSIELAAHQGYEELEGKKVILEFWATWCAPCVASLKHAEKLASNRVAVVAINSEKDTRRAQSFLAKYALNPQVIWDTDSRILERAAPRAFPWTIVLDTNHCEIWSASGAHPDTLEELEKVVK